MKINQEKILLLIKEELAGEIGDLNSAQSMAMLLSKDMPRELTKAFAVFKAKIKAQYNRDATKEEEETFRNAYVGNTATNQGQAHHSFEF